MGRALWLPVAGRALGVLLAVGVAAMPGWAQTTQTNSPGDARLDLLSAYRKALEQDPGFAAVRAETRAQQEEVPKARAGLLPSLGFNGSFARNNLELTSPNVLGIEQTKNYNDYPSELYTLQLRQPLLRPGSWAQLRLAQAQSDYAVAQQRNERQQLAVKVAESYFSILLGMEQIRLVTAERAAYEATLKLAERGFAAGVATLTDIADARARLDVAAARAIETRNALAKARRQLEAKISEPITGVAELDPAAMVLAPPAPVSPDEWVRRAWERSAEIESAQRNLDAAKADVDRQQLQHAPTVDVIAGAQKADSETTSTLGQRSKSSYVGIQIAIPIFAGGGIEASVRQALARQERAEQALEGLRRDVEVRVREQYDAVNAGIETIQAYRQSLLSAEESFRGTQKGVQAGTRNTVDLLNAESKVFEARQSLAQSRLAFVLALLRLKAAAGDLSDEDIARVNTWFSTTATFAVGG